MIEIEDFELFVKKVIIPIKIDEGNYDATLTDIFESPEENVERSGVSQKVTLLRWEFKTADGSVLGGSTNMKFGSKSKKHIWAEIIHGEKIEPTAISNAKDLKSLLVGKRCQIVVKNKKRKNRKDGRTFSIVDDVRPQKK